MPRLIPAIVLAFAIAASSSVRSQDPPAGPTDSSLPPPVKLTAQQDHHRMMELLKITSLRPGANGHDQQAPNAANYDESKANPYPNLPDPLVLKNGEKVTTPEIWWTRRRPEIVEDFDREIYGRVPKETPKVNWEVTGTTHEKVGEVPVITKTTRRARRQLRLSADHGRHPVDADHSRPRRPARCR